MKRLFAAMFSIALICSLSILSYAVPSDPDEAYDEGYKSGYDDGSNDGYDEGYEDGEDSGYDDGYEEGYDSGFDAGYDNGVGDTEEKYGITHKHKTTKNNITTTTTNPNDKDVVYKVGKDEGYDEGYSEGYSVGYDDSVLFESSNYFSYGYDDGYEAGLKDGEEKANEEKSKVRKIIPYAIIFIAGGFIGCVILRIKDGK